MRVWGLIPLLHLLVVWVLPKKFTDRLVLESDKLRAADQATGVYISYPSFRTLTIN